MTNQTEAPPVLATDPMDRCRFPVDPWALREDSYSAEDLGTTESLFAVGNGYLGMRGNPEEGRDAHSHGTFINGFHETWRIRHAEEAFGFARTGQTIVNVPDAKGMKLYVDDEPLLLATADLQEYDRTLDFRTGVLTRDLIWRTPAGKRVRVTSRRMVSFTQRHLALLSLEIEMLDGDAPIVVSSQILNRQDGKDEYHVKDAAMGEGFDPRRASRFDSRVLEPVMNWHSERRMILGYRAINSGMTLAVGADHQMITDNAYEELNSTEDDLGRKVYRIQAKEGQKITILKSVAYHTSRGVPVRELVDRVRRTLDRVRDDGYEHYFREQEEWLADFWARSDVEIADQPEIEQAVRWNLFQLAQASARADTLGVSAKGVTGSGYEGHYFWDTEIYVMPFLTYTAPHLARNLLRFRGNMLPAARERAHELSQRGALFPWRTINGEEASAYYAAGTAQYHIDADVAHALTRIESESERMTALVQDLLLLARLDSGRPLSSEPVDLAPMIIDAVSDAHAAGPAYQWDIDLPDETIEDIGDASRLHQVLANLLSNARTHTPEGTTVTTSLSRTPDGAGAVIEVSDNGPGIPPELQTQVFDRFARGDSSRSREKGSTGLGLAIVQAVVASHRGLVSLDSERGRTTFRVILPIRPVDAGV